MYMYGYHRCRVRCWIRFSLALAIGLLFITAAALVIEVRGGSRRALHLASARRPGPVQPAVRPGRPVTAGSLS